MEAPERARSMAARSARPTSFLSCHRTSMWAPRWGGLFGFKFSSRRHPRKFGQKRFLAVRRSWRGNGVACFWATSLEKIFGGVIAIISFRREDGCSSLPCRGVLSFRSEARVASEAARVLGGAASHSGHRLGRNSAAQQPSLLSRVLVLRLPARGAFGNEIQEVPDA